MSLRPLVSENLSTLLERSGRVLTGKGHRWDVVLIQEGVSANGPYYKKSAIEKIAALAEGVRCYVTEVGDEFDHLDTQLRKPSQQPLRNEVGFFTNPRVEQLDGRYCACATFVILDDATWLAERLVSLQRHGKLDDLGFSIVAVGLCKRVEGRDVVSDVRELDSTDLVHDPAAGGRFRKLVAQTKQNKPTQKKKGAKYMTESLRNFLSFVKSFDLFESLRDTDLSELSDTELVGHVKTAAEESEKEGALKEVGEIGSVLRSLLKMLEGGKVDEAKKFLMGIMSGKDAAPPQGVAAQKEKLDKLHELLGVEKSGDLLGKVAEIQQEAKLKEKKLSEKKGELTQLTERVAVLETEKSESSANAFVDKLISEKKILPNDDSKAAWKEQYMSNAKLAEKTAAALCEIAMLEIEKGKGGGKDQKDLDSVDDAQVELRKVMTERKCTAKDAAIFLQEKRAKGA